MSKESSSTFSPTQKDFDYVLRLVKRQCRPPVDVENLTSEIIYDATIKGKKPTYRLIIHKCFDELRRLRRSEQGDPKKYHSVLQRRAEQFEDSTESAGASLSLVHLAISRAVLSNLERTILHQHYYLGRSFHEIAASERLKEYKVAEIHRGLISKLRFASENSEM